MLAEFTCLQHETMACYHPRCVLVPPKGRVKFLSSDEPIGPVPAGLGRVVYLPCGNCLGCRLDRRHDLAVLQSLEADVSVHSNWFVTLTYAGDEYAGSSLVKRHVQAFNERMRKFMQYHRLRWRFYGCGEYGGEFGRPHYHLSVFDVPDEIMLGVDKDYDALSARRNGLNHGRLVRLPSPLVDSEGRPYWQSQVIEDRWPFGSHKIYRASPETFEYVAGYVVKKLTGKAGADWRKETGKISEFQFQSRPSIGRPWFDRYKDSIAVAHDGKLYNDLVSVGRIKWRVPRIMMKWFAREKGEDYARLVSDIRLASSDPVPDRQDLKRREDFAKYRASQFNKERKKENE